MKKLVLLLAVVFLGNAAFCQAKKEKENGTIYIEHPYIDAIYNTTKAYLGRDIPANRKLYSDTAKFWISGLDKPVNIEDAFKMWNSDFDFYDSIKINKVGYPDYLHYKDEDQKYVQSWWEWVGKSKKTGEKISIPFVQFDRFNNAGKIVYEGIYGDFSKMVK